jgi:dienelactone hydrolase
MRALALCVLILLVQCARSADVALLPNTKPLALQGDLSEQMVAGIQQFLLRQIDQSITNRSKFWQRDLSSAEAYDRSVETNRSLLRQQIGAVDARLSVKELEYVSSTDAPALVAANDQYVIFAVRWPVFADVYGAGLLVVPKPTAVASIIVLPDADQTPEMLMGLSPGIAPQKQFARRLAENGCRLIIPVLINREDAVSGNARLKRFTNQPHREWIYRQAYEMGRHIIGYEVQKVMAAADFLAGSDSSGAQQKIGVAGYGEGGLIAFYAAALDKRVKAALVSGYFDSRQRVWAEPIYRNVFGLLERFGDAEIASLVTPRRLIVEQSDGPMVEGPPKSREGRTGAAPGKLSPPDFNTAEAEVARANAFVERLRTPVTLIHGNEGRSVGPGSDPALLALLKSLQPSVQKLRDAGTPSRDQRTNFNPVLRQHQQVEQLVNHTQRLMRESEQVRHDFFWSKARETFPAPPSGERDGARGQLWNSEPYKKMFWNDVIGRFPASTLPLNPRSRQTHDTEKWTGYDVVLDLWPDVFAWGVLLLPKDFKPGERRPVVVCQHGLEGLPEETVTQDPKAPGYGAYKGFASRLAERGFVVFAPHNPYRGRDKFRVLQRQANLLGKSLFSVILEQHSRILDWLSEQPFVDPKRIGFYGLSYGGKTAMRVPSLLDRYALSICSADFNEWIRKNVTVDSTYSYMFTMEYEMPEFDLGNTFNYAEMAALIAPRPFMVERGHNDGVAPDEWVAYEYAKVRRFYDQLGIGDRTEIEFFNGPHTINGQGTFRFLHHHLAWPEPAK